MLKFIYDLAGLLLVSLGLFLIAEKPASISGFDFLGLPEAFGVFSLLIGLGTLYLGYRRSDRDSFTNYLVHRLSDWLAA